MGVVGGAVRAVAPPLAILVGLILFWLLALALIGVPRYVIPGPIDVLRSWQGDPGSYEVALEQTLVDAGLGWAAGMALGFVLAVLMTESAFLNTLALPWVLLLRSVPIVAIAPILTLLFGYSFLTVVIIAAIVAFFPTLVLTSVGMRDTPPGAEAVFQMYAAGRWDTLRKLRLPSGVINMLGAAKIAAAGAVLGAMVGEWTTSDRGLGYMILVATGDFDVSRVWGAGVLATIVAVSAFVLVDRLARRIAARMS